MSFCLYLSITDKIPGEGLQLRASPGVSSSEQSVGRRGLTSCPDILLTQARARQLGPAKFQPRRNLAGALDEPLKGPEWIFGDAASVPLQQPDQCSEHS